MNKDDIEFLKELQQQMLTQDNCGTASPRYWTVIDTVREYGLSQDYSDSWSLYDVYNPETYYDTMEECYELLKEVLNDLFDEDVYYNIYIDDACTSIIISDFTDEDLEDKYDVNLCDIEEIKDYLNDVLEYNYDISYYRNVDKIVENTMFLTLEDCKRHIKSNHYHYHNPRPYCMMAWRSPEVERLWNILENTNWDEFNK